jgi:hypothetical protein
MTFLRNRLFCTWCKPVMVMILLFSSSILGFSDNSDEEMEYAIGDIGPGGGFIFYKAKIENGCVYYEVAPQDLGPVRWGLAATYVEGNDYNGGPETLAYWEEAFGKGKANTIAIVAAGAKAGTAARVCTDYRGGGKRDWFLPSTGELDVICANLYNRGKGGFKPHEPYWSSTTDGDAGALSYDFYEGRWVYVQAKYTLAYVRPVRAFFIETETTNKRQ